MNQIRTNLSRSAMRMSGAVALAMCATAALHAQVVVKTIPGDPVKIESGSIAGLALPNGVKEYLGVPYAAPPVGPLRWREPQPVQAWEGVYQANRFGNKCPQTADLTPEGMSEDCLFLNIWAPATAKAGAKLPVILYFHGGGDTGNSGARPFYNGRTLAANGVIHITVNWRLGPFAHFASPELTAESPFHSSGNYEHYDQLAAMKWVQRNIAAFGGDPENVTLMGLSNGSIKIGYTQASPVTKGLYKRVIALSGSPIGGGAPMGTSTLKESEQDGQKFMAGLGAKSLADMRAIPMVRLLQGVPDLTLRGAVIDGYLLTDTPDAIFAAGKQVDVPAIYGNSRDESMSSLARLKTVAEFRDAVTKMAGPKADQLLKLFPVSRDEDVPAVATRLANAAEFSRQMVGRARAHVATGKTPVYLDMFARAPALHGYDLPYWFDILDLPGAVVDSGRKIDATDHMIAQKMNAAIVAFVKTGDPSTPSLKWPQYRRDNEVRMVFGDTVQPLPVDEGVKFFVDNPDIKAPGAGPAAGAPARPAGAPL